MIYLEKYYLMECTSLLELAILRNERMMHKIGKSQSTSSDDKLVEENVADDMHSLTTAQIVCGCNVIIPLVLQFIDHMESKQSPLTYFSL